MTADYKPHEASVHDFTSFEELLLAAKQCTKNVGWKENVTKWMANRVSNVLKLKAELDSRTYYVSPAHVFHITDPKPRTISATRFRDRVVQRAICNNGAYEKLTAGLIYDNCACQKGKGVSFAIKRIKHHMLRYFAENHTNRGYIVRLDIRKYFPSIPHEKLKESLKHAKLEAYQEELIFQMIDEFVKIKQDDDLSFNDPGFGVRGIGLGSQLSQLMALFYLSPLDHELKEHQHVKHYIRYMDDMIMIVPTYEEAKRLMAFVSSFIQPLGLKLNPKSHIAELSNEFEFLKMRFKLTATGKVKHKVVKKAMDKEIKRTNRTCRMFKESKIPFQKLLEHTCTWFGYAHDRASRAQVRMVSRLLRSNFEGFERVKLS